MSRRSDLNSPGYYPCLVLAVVVLAGLSVTLLWDVRPKSGAFLHKGEPPFFFLG